MKSTGIVRKSDSLGRLVIPKELRHQLGIMDNEDAYEIFTENDSIVLKKYKPACIFCNEVDDVVEYHNQKICRSCIRKLYEMI